VAMLQAYQALLKRQGAVVRTGLPVRRFLLNKESVLGVETDQGKVLADAVVNCAGPWAPFDTALPFQIQTHPVKGQIVQMKTDQPLVRSVVKSGKTYLVQRDPQTLLVGTTVEYAGFDKQVTEEATRSILDRAQSVVSRVTDLSREKAWVGLRPGTPDGLPILGPTPLKGLWMATGHFRNGILLAPLTGRLLADGVLGVSTHLDMTPFRVDRFLPQSIS